MDRTYYEHRKAASTEEAAAQKKRLERVGRARLFFILAVLALLAYGFLQGYSSLLLISAAVCLLLNLLLWGYQAESDRRYRYHTGLCELADQYLIRMDGDARQFPDSGIDFADENHPYAADLDLFGPGSLFQLLNVAKSYHGRKAFAHSLTTAAQQPEPATLTARQQAIGELAALRDFALDYQYASTSLGDPQLIPNLIAYVKKDTVFLRQSKWKTLLSYGPAVIAPLALALLVLTASPALKLTGLTLLLLQTFLWLFFLVRTNQYLAFGDKVSHGLKPYTQLFTLLENQSFQSPWLTKQQAQLTKLERSAATGLKELDKIVSRTDFRHSTILYFLLNVLFLWDLHCSFLLEKWRETYTDQFAGWFETLGEFESLLCYSVLPNVTENLVFPTVMAEGHDSRPGSAPTSQTNILAAKKLGHPLLHPDVRVTNDFTLKRSITILSGSNMSGKTTFMRTIALNLVLAQAGSMVCAAEFRFSPRKIVTSMRITDNLSEGTSTFYAELKKIRRVMELAQRETEVIFFIDEIFRGTNSEDRIAGARQVIAKLSQLHACGMLTTHDLALCRDDAQTNTAPLINWHFSEEYVSDGLKFDYQLKPGIAESTNGRYLMRLLGVID